MIESNTGYLDTEQLDAKVLAIVDDFRGFGIGTVYVTFGFGCRLDKLVQWDEVPVCTSELPRFLDDFAAEETFELGEADLHIRGGGVEFRLCHEHDVHCSGDGNPLILSVRRRWARDYPKSWDRTSGGEWRRLTGRPKDSRNPE